MQKESGRVEEGLKIAGLRGEGTESANRGARAACASDKSDAWWRCAHRQNP
jgi:hypothetical protein